MTISIEIHKAEHARNVRNGGIDVSAKSITGAWFETPPRRKFWMVSRVREILWRALAEVRSSRKR